MRRREFLGVFVGAAATWPLAARAQQAKVPTVGVLALGNSPIEPFVKGRNVC